jgi:hypothetical protein
MVSIKVKSKSTRTIRFLEIQSSFEYFAKQWLTMCNKFCFTTLFINWRLSSYWFSTRNSRANTSNSTFNTLKTNLSRGIEFNVKTFNQTVFWNEFLINAKSITSNSSILDSTLSSYLVSISKILELIHAQINKVNRF